MAKPTNPNTGTFVVTVSKVEVKQGKKNKFGTLHGTIACDGWNKDAGEFRTTNVPVRMGMKSPWADRLEHAQGRTLTVAWEAGAHEYQGKTYLDYNVTNVVGLEAAAAPAKGEFDDFPL